MISAKMKVYRIDEFSFVNKTVPGQKIGLENTFSYNVQYNKTNVCKGKMTVTVKDKENPDSFSLTMVCGALFEIDQSVGKEKIHVDTFRMLFAHAKASICAFTANSGISPVMIPEPDVESQNIYRFDPGAIKPL